MVTVMVTLIVAAAGCAAPPDNTTSGTPLDGPGWYPRVIRLEHGPAAGALLASTDRGGQGAAIWRSDDDGATFDQVGSLPPLPGGERGWSSLFEMPRAVGDTGAGTVFWAAASGVDRSRMRVEIWASVDAGAAWSFLSTCFDSAGVPGGGLGGIFEPNLHLTDDDRLVCTYATETNRPAHSQTLDQAVSLDGGHTWGEPARAVAIAPFWQRPGMPTVTRLPDGRWVMAYEICGFPTVSCPAFIRYSSDGVDWGDPASEGQLVTTTDGALPSHAPVITWAPWGGPLGTLIMTTQEFSWGGLSRTDRSGNTLLVNRVGGNGNWTYATAPVSVDFRDTNIPSDQYDWCSNYSSPVIPLDDAGAVIQLASAGSKGRCRTFFATGRL
jgi:hypothetical protein